ncbi:MAG TPA: chlorite dismutase family protein [Candidatus Dormibacteraeota bacterium]|nr:chlorite dismutase family protein [Candidatus Dormibacteraeota bacterium]
MTVRPPRQFVAYTFYRVRPEWRRLDAETRDRGRREVVAVVEEYRPVIFVRAYSLVGTRADCDFMLWKAAAELEIFQRLEADLNRTEMGGYLDRPYGYLCAMRPSAYASALHPEGEGQPRVRSRHGRYLFVYPFVKARSWYRLPRATREELMREHVEVGRRYPEFEVNTAYSFGLDDQEFVVSFEGDDPHRFQDLVMELRETGASSYTERDVPIFTCLAADLGEALELAA